MNIRGPYTAGDVLPTWATEASNIGLRNLNECIINKKKHSAENLRNKCSVLIVDWFARRDLAGSLWLSM
jgi:hypothetical protein